MKQLNFIQASLLPDSKSLFVRNNNIPCVRVGEQQQKMKSKIYQLESRGFVAAGIENNYPNTTFEQSMSLLQSKLPADRTLGARLIATHAKEAAIGHLIEALQQETKLYCRLEICNSLVSYGKASVLPLIAILGKVGTNQYKEVPKAAFKKNNYPLPRDIAARTLIRIGSMALPELVKLLADTDLTRLSEAIDAIGFICFYDVQVDVFESLRKCFSLNHKNELIEWKLIRAMSAFPESVSFLTEQQHTTNARMKTEIERSLSLINKRNLVPTT